MNRKAGTCQNCGKKTSRTSNTRCKSCQVRDRWADRGIPRIPPGVLVDDCFREEIEKRQWRIKNSGYVGDSLDRLLHRVIWQLSGRPMPLPPLTIDHANQNTLDNRLENLRVATKSLQSLNTKDQERTLPRGVIFNPMNGSGKPRAKPYMARATCNGKKTFLGMFATPEEAYAAYEAKRDEVLAIEVQKSLSLSSPEISR